MIFAIIILISVCLIIHFTHSAKPNLTQHNYTNEDEVLKKEQEKNKKIHNDLCKKLYQKYQNEGYNISDDETNEIISSSYGLSKTELIHLYNEGKSIIEIEEENQIIEQRKKEQENYNLEKNIANIHGKEKYLKFLNEKLEGLRAIRNVSELMSECYISGAINAEKPPQSDPYILGGIANGIAGPAAGIMTAINVQQKNEEAKARGKIIAKNSLEESKKWRKDAHSASHKVADAENVYSKFTEALIVDITEKYNDKISFENTKYSIIDSTQNIKVSVKCLFKDIKVLNKPGILDGSFKINVLDSNNNTVATGIYNAKNLEILDDGIINVNDFGFQKNNSFDVICISYNYKNISSNNKYHIEIEPIHLWIIERKW